MIVSSSNSLIAVNNGTPAKEVRLNISSVGTKGDKGNDGLGADNFVTGEVANGLINGSNATFASGFNFVSDTLEVFLCKIRLDLLDDYNIISANQIQLVFSPLAGEKIIFNYQKA